jgi:3-deoxy-D-manno-octulosonic-acid transferase
MNSIWLFIYNVFFLPPFWVGAKSFSAFNTKIKTAFRGRKELFKFLESKVASLDSTKRNILIHCSSLGEFEQAKPIIDELDKTLKYNFVISFFSPSGFNHSRLDTVLNSKAIKTYLPFDTRPKIRRFIEKINPAAVIFVKYDLWLNFLKELQIAGVPRILINGSYNKKRFKWRFFLTRAYRKYIYSFFDYIFVASDKHRLNFEALLPKHVKVLVSGDTKYERIAKAREVASVSNPLGDGIISGRNVFVIGSSWDKDNELLLPVLNKINSNGVIQEHPLLSVIVPHEPTEDTLEEIEHNIRVNFPYLSIIRYSDLNRYSGENTILVDKVGILMALYKYADFAYVGGGFQSGLHNVLEPAGYSIPVMFGNEKLSSDAEILLGTGGGFSIHDDRSLYKNLLIFLKNDEERKKAGANSFRVFEGRTKASQKIAEVINKIVK